MLVESRLPIRPRWCRATLETPARVRREFGYDVDIVDDVRAIEAGSPRVVHKDPRAAIDASGDVPRRSKSLLGRPASVWGEVVHGLKRGRELGFPTANLTPDPEGLVPADGVYAGWLIDEGIRLDGLRALGSLRYAGRHQHRDQPHLRRHRRARQVEATCWTRRTSTSTGIVVESAVPAKDPRDGRLRRHRAAHAQMVDDVVRVRRELS